MMTSHASSSSSASSMVSASSSSSSSIVVSSSSSSTSSLLQHDMVTSHNSFSVIRGRVLVVGDAATGKTSLLRMLASSGTDFPKTYLMTTGIELHTKRVRVTGAVSTPTLTELMLLDTPGAIAFNQREEAVALWSSANMIVVVFDIGSPESFASAPKWLRRAYDARARSESPSGGKPLIGVLIGNKADFRDPAVDRAAIKTDDAAAFAASVGLKYFETSVENPSSYLPPFEYLANEWHKSFEAAAHTISGL